MPTGPVAVYSASNFPFAFSVAGGDTASALAAGCPVVVKAHSGHPELSRRTAAVVSAALAEAGAPEGTFGLIEGTEAGRVLIQEPAITAGAFTGSLTGGRALFDLASGRPAPVPFYAELGSINPVVVTADAVAADGAALAKGLVGSFTLGAGQFCTKPGVVFVPEGAGFEAQVAEAMGGANAAPLLNQRIVDGFGHDLGQLAEHAAVEVDRRLPVGRRHGGPGPDRARHLGRRGGGRSRGPAGRVLRSGDPAGALRVGGRAGDRPGRGRGQPDRHHPRRRRRGRPRR